MIKPGALVMGLVMGAVSAGTYYGLDLLPPGLIPPPLGRIVAEGEPAAPAHEAPATVAVAAAPAPVEPAPSAEPTEQDLAEEPPPPAPAPAPVADEPETAPESAAAAPAPAPEPAPAPKATPKPAPAPAAKPAPAPEPEKPAEVAKIESTSPPPAAAAPAPAPAAKSAPESDVIKPWWPDPSKMPETQLKLQYAGQVQGQLAIALLFSSAPKLDTLKDNATVRASSGETVAGEWTLGKNPRLAVFSGVTPGRYTVILQPQIADEKGYMLGVTLKGPVYVKGP